MDFDKYNKYYNVVFLFIYSVSIMIYILLFGINYDSKVVLKKYEVKKEESIINKVSFTSIEYKNYNFNIPDKYRYEVDESIFIFNEKSWIANIQIFDCAYDDIIKNTDIIKETLEKYNYKVGNINDTVINNLDFLIVEISELDTTHFLIYTKLDKYKTYAIEIVSMDSENYTNIIEQIVKIIETGKRSNEKEVKNNRDDLF